MYTITSEISNDIINSELDFFNEFVNYTDIEDNIKGIKLGKIIDILPNFNALVYIFELNIKVIAPIFYNNSISIKVNDIVIVQVENLLTYTVLSLHAKTENYINDVINETKISSGENSLSIDGTGIKMSLDNTKYTFKETGITVSSKDSIDVNIGNKATVYFNELNFQGNLFDVLTGSMFSFMLPTTLFKNGISLRSFIGNIDITSTVGNTNISSGTFTNIGSLVMTNIVSTGLVNITAPLIPNLTIGFFAPLLPSPAGIIGYKDLFTNLISPLKAPLPMFADDFMKKIRDFIPL